MTTHNPYQPKDIVEANTIERLVEVYQESMAEMEEGFRLLAQSESRLNQFFGDFNKYTSFSLIDHNAERWYMSAKEVDAYIASVKARISTGVWKQILDKTGIHKVLSEKRQQELEGKLKARAMPPLTVEEVWSLLMAFTQNAKDIQEELYKEVYQDLRPANWDHYKTNSRYEIGPKLIMTGTVEHRYSWEKAPYQVSYYREDKLIRLDRVFHLMAGKGIPEGYRSPLVDAINTSPTGQGETEFFGFKAFMNGNLHIKFLKPELVKQLNAICGGFDLRGEAA